MRKERQHISESAYKRTSIFLQPYTVVRFLIAFFLAFSLFPVQAFAAGSNQALTTQPGSESAQSEGSSAGSPDVVLGPHERIFVGSGPLNLIQNGNYDAAKANANSTSAAIASRYATSTASAPSATQREQIKARLNTALMNVSYSTSYDGTSMWCIVDVSDLKAPLSTNASSYTGVLVEEVINANPDLFYAGASWGGGTATSSTSAGVVTILSKVLVKYYYTPSKINSMKLKYEAAMADMLSWVNRGKSYKGSTDAEKVKAVHDWLCRNADYNYAAYYAGGPEGYNDWSPWSAYGALVYDAKASSVSSHSTANGSSGKYSKPVCQGYSLAFIAAMNRLGIQSSFVTNAGHGWNRVRIQVNGTYYWYNLDITWDDSTTGYSTKPGTTYFLKSDSHFKSTSPGANREHTKWSPAGTSGTNTTFDGAWGGGVYPLGSNEHSVSSVSLSPTQLSLGQDESRKLTLTASGTNVVEALATWKSSNTSVATVSSSGVVTSGRNMGTATITVTLGGKSATCRVTVAPTISNAVVTLASGATLTYARGVPRKPNFNVVLNGKTLTKGTDYTVSYPSDSTNPGTKTATITGKGNYSGSISKSYTITCPLSYVDKTGSGFNSGILTTTYNGAARKLTPTLTFKSQASLNYKYTLKEGTDYTVTWPSNVTNAGTKTVTITGRGAWTGTYTYKLKINAASISSASITYDKVKAHTGKAVTQSPVVRLNGNVVPSSNYTVSYSNNVNAGTSARMTITGKGNLTGSKSVTFSIIKTSTIPADISMAGNKTTTISGKANTWVQSGGKWYYKTSASTFAANGWLYIGKSWYYFNSSGVMQTGWLSYKGKWYFLNSGGSMATGWQYIGKKWYYLNPSTGVMATGWQKISGSWYFFVKGSGEMAWGEWREGYWLNNDGTWTYKYKASWKKDSKGWWFGDTSGWYARGNYQWIDGKKYYFNSAGYCTNP